MLTETIAYTLTWQAIFCFLHLFSNIMIKMEGILSLKKIEWHFLIIFIVP